MLFELLLLLLLEFELLLELLLLFEFELEFELLFELELLFEFELLLLLLLLLELLFEFELLSDPPFLTMIQTHFPSRFTRFHFCLSSTCTSIDSSSGEVS